MGTIRDIDNPWRKDLLPAHFRGAQFHAEMGAKESGRRIVMHEFPKRDQPYAEDMGRIHYEFTVRGYCIAYPHDTNVSLYRRDYRIARDLLQEELSRGLPGPLQLPLLDPMIVVCPRWRLNEEERFGGYCTFDMTFQELGAPPGLGPIDSRTQMLEQSKALRQRAIVAIEEGVRQQFLRAGVVIQSNEAGISGGQDV
jgi:DNA circularisation protein N-terminus